tara:strand:+ start:1156 stop:2637 length:1482 start_codon:yes stop_codon:yes gene_type:complete
MKLFKILDQCKTDFKLANPENLKVSGLSCNSKYVNNNFIFSCIKGNKFCGSNFIKNLIPNKKIIILTDDISKGFEHLDKKSMEKIPVILTEEITKLTNEILNILYPSRINEIIAVTGTNGKTSVVDYTRQIWHKKKFECASFGTLGVFYKDKKIINSNLTTFEPELFFKSLNKINRMGCNKLIIEASSIGVDQNRIYPIKFNKIGFTNLTHDHLDYHKTFKNYKMAKAKLFQDFSDQSTVAVLNSDDKYFEYFKKKCLKQNISFLDYGYKAKFLKIINIKVTQKNTSLYLKFKNNGFKFNLGNTSLFDIYNRLCSIILVHGKNLSKEKLSIINRLVSPPGRLEKVFDKNFTIFIDYAHTPDALQKVLESLTMRKGNVISLIGCGGERDYNKRPIMTKIALKHSKFVILADDNPRNEDPEQIRSQMIGNISDIDKKRIFNIGNRKRAIKEGINLLRKNDIFVIFGKGHERFQLIGNKKKAFSDSDVVLKIIKGL